MKLRPLALAVTLACACASSALARPYAISYHGAIKGSNIVGVHNGEKYSVTFVLDNGGESALNQVWNAAHLTCTIWRMNDASDVVYAQSLVTRPPNVENDAATNGAGTLTRMFTRVDSNGAVPPGSHTSSGIAMGEVLWTAITGAIPIFVNHTDTYRQFQDFIDPGGIRMIPGAWTPPKPFDGPCTAVAEPPPPPAPQAPAAVPALAPWGLAVLAAGVAGLPALRCRRSRTNT